MTRRGARLDKVRRWMSSCSWTSVGASGPSSLGIVPERPLVDRSLRRRQISPGLHARKGGEGAAWIVHVRQLREVSEFARDFAGQGVLREQPAHFPSRHSAGLRAGSTVQTGGPHSCVRLESPPISLGMLPVRRFRPRSLHVSFCVSPVSFLKERERGLPYSVARFAMLPSWVGIGPVRELNSKVLGRRRASRGGLPGRRESAQFLHGGHEPDFRRDLPGKRVVESSPVGHSGRGARKKALFWRQGRTVS